ncbi:MAG: hypothetical protein BWZ00_00285 [Bacteroidetes bacterium ADurb.BinA174]|jgi:hypothetical protein|nr:MAG: hypothetical protein BWZ00_00285 [Bacteroidetes bacterium ADurb.BinA174]
MVLLIIKSSLLLVRQQAAFFNDDIISKITKRQSRHSIVLNEISANAK